MGEITPVFVCGMGRSGTTNALRILNTHPSVMLNGEIPLSVLKHFFSMLDGVDRSYAISDGVKEGWLSRKADYIFESFGYLSKGGRGRLEKANSAKFRGHKSPRLETLFEQYESHFDGLGPPPRYFYCARNPFDCWQSYRAMEWSSYDGVEQFLRHYKASFDRLKQMREVAEGRVVMLNLDELKKASDPLAYYLERIFAPLGLNVPDKSTARMTKIDADREPSSAPALSADDKCTIASYSGVGDIIETYFPNAISASR
jgi:hypothetical protein